MFTIMSLSNDLLPVWAALTVNTSLIMLFAWTILQRDLPGLKKRLHL